MPKDTKTLGNNKARACESLGFAHKKGCANILTQPPFYLPSLTHVMPMNRAVREVSEGGEGNIKKIVLVFPSSSEPD